MKLAQQASEQEVFGAQASGGFKIAASGTAFKILSSSLYTNKPRAVMRELSCNGFDSHVAAGKKGTPIRVNLPTRFYPYFEVIDEGMGLSHDQVMNLYSTYFESTKRDSNDFIGALGLGSKSPFSYTESFMVSSVYSGVERVYAASIDENFMPTIHLLSEMPTDKVNGVAVKVPVRTEDFTRFAEEAKTVYTFFDPMPKFNTEVFVIQPRAAKNTPIYNDNGLEYFLGRQGYGDGAAHYIIQGIVAYPVETKLLLDLPGLSEIDRRMINKGHLAIRVEIGECDVAASRESISFDEATRENISKRIRGFGDKLIKDFCEQKIDKEECLFDAIAKYGSEYSTMFDSHGVIKYRGKDYKQSRRLFVNADTYEGMIEKIGYDYSKRDQFRIKYLAKWGVVKGFRREWNKTKSMKIKDPKSGSCTNTANVNYSGQPIYFNDEKVVTKGRAKFKFSAAQNSFLLEGLTPDLIQELCENIGCSPAHFKLVSTLNAPPAADPKDKDLELVLPVYFDEVGGPHKGTTLSDDITITEVNERAAKEKRTVYYFTTYRDFVREGIESASLMPNAFVSNNKLLGWSEFRDAFMLSHPDIILVRVLSSNLHLLKKKEAANWKEATSVYLDTIVKEWKGKNVYEAIQTDRNYRIAHKILSMYVAKKETVPAILQPVMDYVSSKMNAKQGTNFENAKKIYNAIIDRTGKTEKYRSLQVDAAVTVIDMAQTVKKFLDRYPLLNNEQAFVYDYTNIDFINVKQYIDNC